MQRPAAADLGAHRDGLGPLLLVHVDHRLAIHDREKDRLRRGPDEIPQKRRGQTHHVHPRQRGHPELRRPHPQPHLLRSRVDLQIPPLPERVDDPVRRAPAQPKGIRHDRRRSLPRRREKLEYRQPPLQRPRERVSITGLRRHLPPFSSQPSGRFPIYHKEAYQGNFSRATAEAKGRGDAPSPSADTPTRGGPAPSCARPERTVGTVTARASPGYESRPSLRLFRSGAFIPGASG